jgi:hypothetical protein
MGLYSEAKSWFSAVAIELAGSMPPLISFLALSLIYDANNWGSVTPSITNRRARQSGLAAIRMVVELREENRSD